ncbi:HAMP domain-containing protein [Qipengyuania sp. 1NDH17]|uniref:histidine kinase n=1 Tax=Qipengyuania polymorpha TaxID=2867234 RepID=A0ABS7IVA1_9SPHN|nr:ATP-binding protein [Qipengyuania polymorpha]MBX7457384.1 HAMP domain-containing protein [Qipengyuania polymorpha]
MASQATPQTRRTPRLWRRFVVTSRRANLFSLIEIAAVAAFFAMVATTWATFSSAPPNGQLLPSSQVAVLLIGTLIPAMALLVLAGRRLALRRAAGSTARLHVRLVFFFSMVAAVPTLLVAAFAAVLFQSGVDFWFSDNSRGLMENANALAESYYEDNQLDLAEETISMAMDMNAYIQRISVTDPDFLLAYEYQAGPRDVVESAILQAMPDGSARTAVLYNVSEDSDPVAFTEESLPGLRRGEQVAVRGSPERIEAIAPIDRVAGIYLYTARDTEGVSFRSWERARSISVAYDELTSRARALQLRFNLALFFVSLALVGLAVWFALRFADRQVEPLTDLVAAARKVGAGNFGMRVEGRTGADEIGLLNRAFNRMTAQLERQTDALMSANEELEDRRSFIEAVLESVSAGVITIDGNRRVLLMNAPAQNTLLEGGQGGKQPETLDEMAPQIAAMVIAGLDRGVVSHTRQGELMTLAVKLVREGDGHVITFEDITRQLLDQRQAAWSDVARRIAHEIKNPLTPIQLATERLKRRYRKQIEQDGELFDELTNTIVRQVGDLRKMVDEFSSFARLPKPVFRPEDALDLIRQSLFLQEVANPEINYGLTTEVEGPLKIQADRHQLGQAVTNILKNAAEAIEARTPHAPEDYRGRIAVEVTEDEDAITVAVTDNGIGLPQDRERILEPYVTTRAKGTGLGLAIVNKIVEEHGGEMSFSSVDGGGTRVTLRFARDPHGVRKDDADAPAEEKTGS